MTKTEEIGNVLQERSVDPCEIRLENDYPEPQYLLTAPNGTGTCPRGDIVGTKAKSKNGKTIFVSMLGASIHKSTVFMKSNFQGSTILYFDTEQNERNTARVLRRMNALCGYDTKVSKDEIRAYSIRRIDTLSRWAYITEQVNKRNPAAIIIDGIVDLVQDFNDIKESKEFINKLLQFAQDKDICIICVLHTNKSQDDHGMRGHLGTILEQKASDVFEIVKNGSIFTVTETECRNKAIDSFSFVLDNDCIPQPSATLITVDQQMRNNEITQTLAKVFEKDTILQYNEIVRRYTNIALCCNKTAKNRIKVALANKYLNQLENGGYELHDER